MVSSEYFIRSDNFNPTTSISHQLFATALQMAIDLSPLETN